MDYFLENCRIGNIVKLTELYDTTPNISHKIQDAFELACIHGKRDILLKLYEWGHPNYLNIHNKDDCVFFDAAIEGYTEILEDIYSWRSKNHIFKIEDNFDILLLICKKNHVAILDLLYKWNFKIDINKYDNFIFKIISGYDSADVLTYIYQISLKNQNPIDLSYDNYYVFRNACYYGQLENLKKIYYWGIESNQPIDIHCGFEQPFRFACNRGHTEIMNQLYNWSIETYSRINIRILDEDAFITACNNGELNIIRQLRYWEPDIDIHHNNSSCFVNACKNGLLYIVIQLYEWMLEDDTLYKLENVIHLAVYGAAQFGHITIFKLLFSWFPSIIDKLDNNIIKTFRHYIQIYIYNCINCYKRDWIKNMECSIDQCGICLSETENVISTPCQHKYCKECIITWLMRSDICPYCRQVI